MSVITLDTTASMKRSQVLIDQHINALNIERGILEGMPDEGIEPWKVAMISPDYAAALDVSVFDVLAIAVVMEPSDGDTERDIAFGTGVQQALISKFGPRLFRPKVHTLMVKMLQRNIQNQLKELAKL
jgi:hypothetical protein